MCQMTWTKECAAADAYLTETPSDTIKYEPSGSNEYVGIKGTRIDTSGLILRRSHDEGGIVLFLYDNPYPEWSFAYTITGIDLHFPEEGGVYLWYTEYDQDMGHYKGGKGEFTGLMAGIEFKGMSPELVFSFNNGKNYGDAVDETVSRDSFNPLRLKGVKDLTVKVIVTKKNFKIELYDGNKLLYDSMRIVRNHPYELLGTNKRFSITSSYSNASAEKSFKLLNAQLFERKESAKYDADKVHAEHISHLTQYSEDVQHPDKEIRHFIAQFTHFVGYVKGVLGEADKPTVTVFGQKILQELEKIKNHVNKKTESDNAFLIEKVNTIETRILNMQKSMADLVHDIREMELNKPKSNLMPYFLCLFGGFTFAFVVYKDFYTKRIDKKI